MQYLPRDVRFFETWDRLTEAWCDMCRGGWHAVMHPERGDKCKVADCRCVIAPKRPRPLLIF